MNVSVCRIGLKSAMCFAQHFIAMEHTGIILLTNEISRDLSLTRVSEGDILYWNSLQARITPGFTGANVRQGSSSTFIDMNGIIFIHGETHGRLISSTWHCFDIEVLSVLVAFCEWISLVTNSFSSQKGNWYELGCLVCDYHEQLLSKQSSCRRFEKPWRSHDIGDILWYKG